jgi:hypothetical protein
LCAHERAEDGGGGGDEEGLGGDHACQEGSSAADGAEHAEFEPPLVDAVDDDVGDAEACDEHVDDGDGACGQEHGVHEIEYFGEDSSAAAGVEDAVGSHGAPDLLDGLVVWCAFVEVDLDHVDGVGVESLAEVVS